MTADAEQALTLPQEAQSAWGVAGPVGRQRRRRMLLGVVVAFAVVTGLTGFPTGREVLTFWMLAALLAACGGDVRAWRAAVVRDWMPLLAVLFAYDLLRGVANELGGWLFQLPYWASSPGNPGSLARAHLSEPISVDRTVFGQVPTVWLQQHLFTPGVAHWYDRLIVPVYLSHFVVSLALAIVLWCANYPLFRRYLAALVTLTVAALTTYLLYPAAPPWMAALNGRLPEVHRVVQETLSTLGGQTLNSAVERGAAYSNPVAAMPSLHAAIPMMFLLFFWPEVRVRGRVLLATYAGLMAFALVYGGEHYVTDVVVGWCYAAATVFGLRRLAAARADRSDEPEDEDAFAA